MIGRRRAGSASAKRPWALVPALLMRTSRPPSFSCAVRERAVASVGISHVADDGFGAATEGGDFRDDFGEAIGAAGEQNLVDAGAGQLECECPADAARSAGDERSQTV